MHRRGHAGRVDRNHADVVQALRACGAFVVSLASVGNGCPDLLASFPNGAMVLIEVKAGRGKLTPDEQAWHDMWPAGVEIVRSVDEAIALVQRVRQTHG